MLIYSRQCHGRALVKRGKRATRWSLTEIPIAESLGSIYEIGLKSMSEVGVDNLNFHSSWAWEKAVTA